MKTTLALLLNSPDLLLTFPWINNQEARVNTLFSVINPYTGDTVAEVGAADSELTAQAIEASENAFSHWKQVAPKQRVAILNRWSQLLLENVDDLAKIMTSESGKVFSQAQGEITHCANMLRWYGESLLRMTGETLPSHSANLRAHTIKQPLGVVACITPWNFPAAAVIVKAGAAIAAGNVCVLKPSDETPLIALALAKLASKAGLPDGVFNVLPCQNPEAVGDVLCAHNSVRMLSFTGSTNTGKKLYEQCGKTLKRLAFELGGNAPFIVFDDADIDLVVQNAISARFYNSGQICVGANRFFIHESIHDKFIETLTAAVQQLPVGDPMAESTFIGPMINDRAVTRLNGLITDSLNKGAKLVLGDVSSNEHGVISPVILSNMNASMTAYSQEIFGPIVCVYSFNSEDDVIAAANDTDAGLAAYVFSQNYSRLLRLSESLEAGAIGANTTALFSEDIPFGGIKQSGIGKEQGIHGLEEFVDTKAVCLGIETSN
ncbi:NAD-dependent succinate-semialdehyde dehydrogenase [Sessilibacter corallicola]|uniref:NADP-dependent succinate-semialdehyde dehydrogenase n=1 Tax=Sessilibacter corallicola TaxID=2904075 RepID=A0ABQ0AD04_9GAMM